MRGDAVFVKVDSVETMKTSEIIDIFNQQREKDYHRVTEVVEDLERKVSSIRKGNGIQSTKRLSEAVERYLKEYEEIRKTDFFSSKEGNELKKIAEIVHDLDIKDGKYQSEESKGIEGILRGLRKTGKDDREILGKGMAVMELFYASRI